MSTRNSDFIKLYYLATPMFLLVGLTLGIEIRVTIPGDSQIAYYAYLAGCFILGSVVFKGLSAAVFAIFESAANILLLLLSVMLPLMTAAGDPELAGSFRFGTPELLNFLLVGGVLLYCFYTNPLMRAGKNNG